MAADFTEFRERVRSVLPNTQLTWSDFKDQNKLTVPSSDVFATLKTLKELVGMDMLVDVTAVDFLEYGDVKDRFELVYLLVNTESGVRLIVSTFLNEPDLTVPTVTTLWTGANWLEREVYDMFGIIFAGHPNHKRLLLPEEFASFPLRKDYPVKGRGERHNFPVITRAQS